MSPPATEQEGLLAHVDGRVPVAEQNREQIQLLALSRIRTDAVDVIRNRAGGQIASDLLPLSDEASEAMRRELIRGVDVGANPREAATRMVNAVEGRFNGGLTRALTIARTETLDAYRATSQQIHSANADVVPAWSWLAELDHRTCPSCWAMDGQQFPSAVPGPDDHPQGRCARIPVLASWAELGISAPEPPSVWVDAEERFWSLPEADRLQIMGLGRLRLLQDGSIGFRDLSKLRNNPGWRPSRVPTPLRDLQRRVDRGLPATPSRPPARLATRTLPTPRTAPARSFDDRVQDALGGPDALNSVPAGRGRGLSPDESSALDAYALNRFRPINDALRAERGAAPWIPRTYPEVGTLDAAMARSALPREALVYRGVRSGADVFGTAWNRNLTGAVWTEHGYVSTSANPFVSAGFRGDEGGLMNILVPPGTRGLALHGVEDELLLQRGLRLRVLNDSGPGSSPRRLDVEVIP